MIFLTFPTTCVLALLSAYSNTQVIAAPSDAHVAARQANADFQSTPLTDFNEPWALAFLPDGRILVTEKRGTLRLFDPESSTKGEITGVPTVAYGGQGGFGDVAIHPDFEENNSVYVSYAEQGDGNTAGAVVARATLALDASGGGALEGLEVIWRQTPKVPGNGHFAHRILFDANNTLWISSGERQQFDPAQDLKSNLGKVVRLNDDGSVPSDNPFADQGEVSDQVWAYGLRNPLGLTFDPEGRLWDVEMGPMGGDELNLIERGGNYGWPIVSQGNHYDGRPIPNHDTRPEFIPPKVFWVPVISPSSLLFYTGDLFPAWKGNAFISGLSSMSLVRVEVTGDTAREAQRWPLGKRLRTVKQGPDGALWVLEDGPGGRLLRLTPP